MGDSQIFDQQYFTGSQTEAEIKVLDTDNPSSSVTSGEADDTAFGKVEASRYGIGKPTRKIIRAQLIP